MRGSASLANIPRVTDVLRPFTGYDYIPKEILEKAAERGSSVHALCAGIAKGNWMPDTMIAPELLGYVESFKKWAAAQVKEFHVIEKRYTDVNELFTGQVDFVVKCNDGKFYLVDLKTGAAPQKTHPVQMAAYDSLLAQNGIHVSDAMLVYLDKHGEFPNIDIVEDLGDKLEVFGAALKCYQYFKLRKKNGRKREECLPADSRGHGGLDIHTEG